MFSVLELIYYCTLENALLQKTAADFISRPNQEVTNTTNLIAIRLGFIVSPCWKIMHGLCSLSAKDRVRTGTISVCIKASLTNKLSEISTACIDYTPHCPIFTTHLSITINSSHFFLSEWIF
jgi:hypothetical protein